MADSSASIVPMRCLVQDLRARALVDRLEDDSFEKIKTLHICTRAEVVSSENAHNFLAHFMAQHFFLLISMID